METLIKPQESSISPYDHEDVWEFYWNAEHSPDEIFTLADPRDPKSMRALAEELLIKIGPQDDQIPPEPGELALLLAANAHAYQREFTVEYGGEVPPLSWEEQECVRRGWG
jgi:hypothetical protein